MHNIPIDAQWSQGKITMYIKIQTQLVSITRVYLENVSCKCSFCIGLMSIFCTIVHEGPSFCICIAVIWSRTSVPETSKVPASKAAWWRQFLSLYSHLCILCSTLFFCVFICTYNEYWLKYVTFPRRAVACFGGTGSFFETSNHCIEHVHNNLWFSI